MPSFQFDKEGFAPCLMNSNSLLRLMDWIAWKAFQFPVLESKVSLQWVRCDLDKESSSSGYRLWSERVDFDSLPLNPRLVICVKRWEDKDRLQRLINKSLYPRILQFAFSLKEDHPQKKAAVEPASLVAVSLTWHQLSIGPAVEFFFI